MNQGREGKVGIGEKLGYGLGDTASNIIFQTVVNFIAFYYTDVYGLSPATVGTMFLVVRVMDAVTDPVMGAICDRTHTRWGKFRPYLVWLAIPFGASAVITFTVPDLADTGKLIYAYLTYAFLMLMYTAVNIPYCALGGVMTNDSDERVSIQSWRFVGGQSGNMIVVSLTLPLVAYFGQGDDAHGYQMAMALMSLIAVLLFFTSFATTRERVTTAPEAESGTVREDLKALWANDQWRVLALINFVLLICVVMRGTVAIYYTSYVMKAPEITTAYLTLGSIGAIIGSILAGYLAGGLNLKAMVMIFLIQTGLQLIFLATGMIDMHLFMIGLAAAMLGTALAALLSKTVRRIPAFGITFLLQGIAHFLLFWLGADNLYLSFFLFIIVMILNQIGVPILWSMMADTVDYGELKTGKRITAMNFSANLFALKMGVAVGGAAAGWLLAGFDYVPGAEQSAKAILGISLIFAVFPGICSLGVAFISRFYTLSENRMKEIQAELDLRHQPGSL